MPTTAIDLAHDHMAQGRINEAVASLRAAGSSGDANALMQLAVWYLSGQPVARDLPLARSFLRRAVTIGHVDAALMEIALTANGSGAPADWPTALDLLCRAAANDPVAAEHVQLLSAMNIDAAGDPRAVTAPEPLAHSPMVQRFRSFCTQAECLHVAQAAANMLEPASVFDPASHRMIAHPIRNSDNAPIGPTWESLPIQAINRRIAAATATDVRQGEPLTVLRYQRGQEYRPHVDTLPAGDNQRVLTAILYLNDGYIGGETSFPMLDLAVQPRTGDLLVFANVDAAQKPEPRSRHAGLPVRSGQKWIATRWIRARPTSAWELSEEARASASQI